MRDLGKIAYDAYCDHTDWKSLKSGDDLPQWEDLPLEIQTAWLVSAGAVIEAIGDDDPGPEWTVIQ